MGALAFVNLAILEVSIAEVNRSAPVLLIVHVVLILMWEILRLRLRMTVWRVTIV